MYKSLEKRVRCWRIDEVLDEVASYSSHLEKHDDINMYSREYNKQTLRRLNDLCMYVWHVRNTIEFAIEN